MNSCSPELMSQPVLSTLPSMEEEVQELAALLSYPPISRSLNVVRMLSFVCEKYFAGQTEEIREHSIAIHALGRKELGFDSHADPIVRVTARILRKRLDAFYETEGRSHSLRLVLPVGQYVPKFVRVENIPDALFDPPQPNGSANEWQAHSRERSKIAGVRDPEEDFFQETPPYPRQILDRAKNHALLVNAGLVAALLLVCSIGFWVGRSTAFVPGNLVSSSIDWGKPVWSDEFNGAQGTPPDPANWGLAKGNNNGWGNGEVEVYCSAGSNAAPCDDSHRNAFQDGHGHLALQALKTRADVWTSARIMSLKEFQYGRIEARMKLPVGAGLWPAFWMLGSNYEIVHWPESGSVDFMENISNPKVPSNLGSSSIRSTVHGPGYYGGGGLFQNYFFPDGGRIDDGFHIYGAIWSPDMIQFYVDDPANVFFVGTASDIPVGARWVFNSPFHLVANLAVGGQWPGPPDESTPSAPAVLIDYIRVYKIPHIPAPAMEAQPMLLRSGGSGGTILTLTSKVKTGRVYLTCTGAPANTSCSLAMHVADFTNSPKQEVAISIAARPLSGAEQYATPSGDYTLNVTAQTMSGDTSSIMIPLRVN